MASAAYRSLLEHELSRASERSIITIVRLILADAQSRGASDVHIDPASEMTEVRLRIDGYVSKSYSLPAECHAELIARLKILARLRIDEHVRPQDGRFTFTLQEGTPGFDVRLSIVSTHHGECAVLRLLIPREQGDSLSALGVRADQEQELDRALMQPHGMIVVVGPTGSGKTTTLYALTRRINGTGRSIVSIEDPIEYSLAGIRQVQVMPLYGLTFSDALRALLRQDPDVIIIGEIRDAETASLASNAAHTGHLVLTTVHATDAAGAGARLEELGVSNERLSKLQVLFIGQKLMRIPCAACTGKSNCANCNGTRHAGRRGIFELLYV